MAVCSLSDYKISKVLSDTSGGENNEAINRFDKPLRANRTIKAKKTEYKRVKLAKDTSYHAEATADNTPHQE